MSRPTLFVPVETPKACALIGLHLSTAEGEAGPVAVNLLISETCGGKAVLKKPCVEQQRR